MEREQPYLGDLLTMVINHLLTGMILQVGTTFSTPGVITLESGLQYKVLREGHGHSVKQQLLTADGRI